MKKRILTTFLAGILCLALFLPMGCDLGYVYKGEYEYRLYDKANDDIHEEVLQNNITYDSFIESEQKYADETYPKRIYYVIDSEEKFDEFFKEETEIKPDFETETLFLCFLTTNYNGLKYIITNIDVNDNQLILSIQTEKFILPRGTASAPQQRVVAVIVKIRNIESFEIEGGSFSLWIRKLCL